MICHSNLPLNKRKELERGADLLAVRFPDSLKEGDVVKIKALGYRELAEYRNRSIKREKHHWAKTYDAKFLYAKKEHVYWHPYKYYWIGYFELVAPIESPTTEGLFITHVWRYVKQVYL